MNYIIEGNLNFNDELIKSICEEGVKDSSKNCLISAQPLDENYITLKCKHYFNYSSIFREIKSQKQAKNHLEITKLNITQIKCPYCRTIQEGLLPYSNDFKEKIYGVNWPPKYSYSPKHCQYIFKSGKKKNVKCNMVCFMAKCHAHLHSKNIIWKICKAILKTGKNKGKQCTHKTDSEFCKKHNKKT